MWLLFLIGFPLWGERGPVDLWFEPTGAEAEKKLSAQLTDEGKT